MLKRLFNWIKKEAMKPMSTIPEVAYYNGKEWVFYKNRSGDTGGATGGR